MKPQYHAYNEPEALAIAAEAKLNKRRKDVARQLRAMTADAIRGLNAATILNAAFDAIDGDHVAVERAAERSKAIARKAEMSEEYVALLEEAFHEISLPE